MLKFKRFYICALVLIMIIANCNFVVSANEETSTVNTQNVAEAKYVGEKNGAKVYEATIPVVWESYGEDGVAAAAANDCKATMIYMGNGVWEYYLTFSGMDLIKSLRGSLTTYGVAGSASTTLEKTNLVPGPIITAEAEFHFLHPVESGEQFFKVYGKVTGVYGDGSFGTQINSITVNPD